MQFCDTLLTTEFQSFSKQLFELFSEVPIVNVDAATETTMQNPVISSQQPSVPNIDNSDKLGTRTDAESCEDFISTLNFKVATLFMEIWRQEYFCTRD